ncbi:hypothetical protein JJB07_07590 [Tumebacillus sp. ITR2]|uniref:Yip1 domain-containing protein n=1 Tax=Tumebacillus amylolyticus TaxID=2801339 RepID=A0ABS1J8B3_9BACL|nr:hypothetical protein [Tumebacillus amylolyticus]MBL0386508.1 hypothetical protein [Tumebacillus amylolyticus]
MGKHLIAILFRPRKTLERVLTERRLDRSRGTTWLLIGLNVLVMFVFAVFFFRFVDRNREPAFYFEEELLAHLAMWVVFGGLLIGSLTYALVTLGLGRVFFSWIVRIGLRISAHDHYPTDPEHRKENGRLLRLIHPYTTWINFWPKLLSILLAPLLLLLPGYAMMLDPEAPIHLAPSAMVATYWVTLGLWCVFIFLQVGMWVYMIIARTIAIQKIYGIGAGQAFWGPLLLYGLLLLAGVAICVFLVLLNNLLGGVAPYAPDPTPDFSSHLGL